MGQARPPKHRLAQLANVRRKLAFVGHTSLSLPLLLVYALPDGVLVKIVIKGISETDISSLLDAIIYAICLIDVSHFQWQVLFLGSYFGPEKVSICLDQPFRIIDGLCKHIGLILTMNPIAAIFSGFVIA